MMQTRISHTTAPMHIVVLSNGTMDDLQRSLECVRDDSGYPHVLTVVEMTGEAAARDYLLAMARGWDVGNLLLPEQDANFAEVVTRALQEVEAPYAMLLPSGVVCEQGGWLRRALGTMLRSGAPAVACGCKGASGSLENLLQPVGNPTMLSEFIASSASVVLATRNALDRLGVFEKRCITGGLRDTVSAAEIATSEYRRQAVRAAN